MGSMISLGIGNLEIEWGKNNIFRNHSKLFLPSDVKEIPYYYADNIIENREGFSRKLVETKRRLELLGYPLQHLKSLYESDLAAAPSGHPRMPITFDEFFEILTSLDVGKIQLSGEEEYDLGEFVSKYLFQDSEFNKRFRLGEHTDRYIGEIFENIDPYIILRILMENPSTANRELMWRYADVLEGGWVERDELYEQLDYGDKILLVTEGSSDSFIINRSLEILYPDIKDFFYFVDMEDHYPFTGTGNLYRFTQGLCSIKILNKVLVIYDNDLAGMEKFSLSTQLSLPRNMKVVKLPDREDFKKFPTVGPNGQSFEDINGSAVSIECFLDLTYQTDRQPCVRWTTFDPNTQKYQGELVNKDEFVRRFARLNHNADYDFAKLKYLIDYLFDQWISTLV